MSITPVGIGGLVQANLLSTTLNGYDLPRVSTGIGIGVSTWLASVIVNTVDIGSAGVGSGGPLPVIVPTGLLGVNTLAGFAGAGLVGQSSPLFATGIANGLEQALLQALIVTAHVGVGVGSAVAKFNSPPAGPFILAGFASAGLTGQFMSLLATGIGQGLDTTFASLVIPLPIAGTASPTASSGTGVGKIV